MTTGRPEPSLPYTFGRHPSKPIVGVGPVRLERIDTSTSLTGLAHFYRRIVQWDHGKFSPQLVGTAVDE